MKNKPNRINPAMPTNIAWWMVACGVILGILVGWLLPIGFDGSFIWGVIVMIATDIIFLVIFRRITIAKQTAANAKLAAEPAPKD
ncbi:hypothetical protein [Furfurilactobacillus siliginis]|uniref:Uncharacterized protein n=1 Tax=Furfurilactobacillus siliginis TaxID=348151 RepID=A0A0R2LCV2_9LACO|nr:hypothetical protein [Furfurilactobacillus siliginis]KRN96988.1 hypothetical protein IV55_GL000864 [Furfurilactobacillus siliginis]GEK27747.1 hypothetical protein LSI01_00580 [Furfurilactobacillus siliginis]